MFNSICPISAFWLAREVYRRGRMAASRLAFKCALLPLLAAKSLSDRHRHRMSPLDPILPPATVGFAASDHRGFRRPFMMDVRRFNNPSTGGTERGPLNFVNHTTVSSEPKFVVAPISVSLAQMLHA